jgi:hypothetical protein
VTYTFILCFYALQFSFLPSGSACGEPGAVRLSEVANPEDVVKQAGPIYKPDIDRDAFFFQAFRQKGAHFGHGQAMGNDMRRRKVPYHYLKALFTRWQIVFFH